MEALKYKIKSIDNLNIIILVLIFFNIFNGVNVKYFESQTYFSNLISNISNPFYNITLFLVLLYVTVISVINFDTNYNVLNRYKSYPEYLENLIKEITFNTIFIFIINFILTMLVLLIFFEGEYQINQYYNYNISELVYFIFYIFRICMIMELLIVIIIMIEKLSNSIVRNIISIVFVCGFILNSPNVIQSFSLNIFVPSTYINIKEYASFANEICYSSIFLMFLIVIIFILNNILQKRKIDIG